MHVCVVLVRGTKNEYSGQPVLEFVIRGAISVRDRRPGPGLGSRKSAIRLLFKRRCTQAAAKESQQECQDRTRKTAPKESIRAAKYMTRALSNLGPALETHLWRRIDCCGR